MILTSTRSVALRVAACLLAATAAAARVAPDPLPSYASLTPASTDQLLPNVSGMIGNFLMVGPSQDQEVYIWDIAFAQLPNGTKVIYRYEFQSVDGHYGAFDASATLPSGTSTVTATSGIYGSGAWYVTDSNGFVQVDLAGSFVNDTITQSGAITWFPGRELPGGRSTCGFGGGIYVCGNNCTWLGGGCTLSHGSCQCQYGSCPFIVAAQECRGSCGMENFCLGDGAGGCGCQ